MSARTMASNLSAGQRERLIAHIRGPQTIDYRTGPEENLIRRAVVALLGKGLVRNDTYGGAIRPKHTLLTELGREVVCHVLGDYADGLVTAGVLEEPPLIQITRLPRVPLAARAAAAAPAPAIPDDRPDELVTVP